jgi:hypothetical protein
MSTDIHLARVQEIIDKYDNIELLSKLHYYLLTDIETLSYNQLLDSGSLHFITGLTLKEEFKKWDYLPDELVNVVTNDLLAYYQSFYSAYINQIYSTNSQINDVLFRLQSFNILNQVNYGGYQFQYDDMCSHIFGKFDHYFEEIFGFTISDVMTFARKIKEYYDLSYQQKIKSIHEFILKKKRISKVSHLSPGEVRTIFNEMPVELRRIKEVFLIKVDNFCKENQFNQYQKFEKYLDTFSVRFGDQYTNFNSPLDKNIIFEKPIIKLEDGHYFCPIPQLLFDYHTHFSNPLADEIRKQTKIGDRYRRLKSSYLETRIKQYLKRLFPDETIFNNLDYIHNGTKFEIDVLVRMRNRLLIFEAKSGELSHPALRGAPKRLSSDFGKIIGEAFLQGKNTIEYIKRNPNPKFYDDRKRMLLQIESSDSLQCMVCNVTLYPLRGLATNPQDLESLQVFPPGEYPWYVSLFDLDIITNHLPAASFFIDYIEKRLKFKKEDAAFVLDELQFLNLYLKNLDFSELKSNIFNDLYPANLIDPFDFHYILGKEKSNLSLDKNLLELIRKIEGLDNENSIDVIRDIISIKPKQKEFLIRRIREKTIRFRKDKSPHCCSLKFDPFNFGLTFFVRSTPSSDDRLIEICHIAKDKYHTSHWIGIDYILSGDKEFINKIYTCTDESFRKNLKPNDHLNNILNF